MTEVGGNEVKRARQWYPALPESLTFQLLSGRVVNLEDIHVARKGGLSQREAVEARADDDILMDTSPNCRFQDILRVPRAEDGPPVSRVLLQCCIQDGVRITKFFT